MMTVSVILPAYNCESYIGAAVESVLKQSYPKLELIVVDDGSTDGTLRALEPYWRHLRIIQQENAGAAAARNTGIRAATGEYLAFLDADDWWYSSRLSSQLEAFRRHPSVGMVFSDFTVTDAAGVPYMQQGIRQWYSVWRDASKAPWSKVFEASAYVPVTDAEGTSGNVTAYAGHLARWLFLGNFIFTSTVLLRRDVIQSAGLFDTDLVTEEDYDLWLRIAQNWPLAFVDAPLVARRRRPGQLTDPSQIERITRNVRTVIDRAKEQMGEFVTPIEIRRRLARLDLDLGVICLRDSRNAEARQLIWQSIRGQPGAWPQYLLFLLACGPAGLYRSLEQFNRRLRGMLRSGNASQ
jgi:cellulose synthase/poly-beta-1,6-N-acetylglucosamine synthase-like glycosyltransferase